MSAAQQGKTYTVESLLPAVERLLLDIESVLPRESWSRSVRWIGQS